MSKILQLSFVHPLCEEIDGAIAAVRRQTELLETRHEVFTIVVDWENRLNAKSQSNIKTFKRKKSSVSILWPFPASSRAYSEVVQYVAKKMNESDYILVQGLQCYLLYERARKKEPNLIKEKQTAIVFHDIESEYFLGASEFTTSLYKKFYYYLTYLQFLFLEKFVLEKSRNLLFLTSSDLEYALNLVEHHETKNMSVVPPLSSDLLWTSPDNNILTIGYFGDCTLAVNRTPLEKEVRELGDLDIQILIAGKGTKSLATLPSNVDIFGYVTDLESYISKCDLLWFPIHHRGGLKIKLVDAISSGAPVVTTLTGARDLMPELRRSVITYKNVNELRQILRNWKRLKTENPYNKSACRTNVEDTALDPSTWR